MIFVNRLLNGITLLQVLGCFQYFDLPLQNNVLINNLNEVLTNLILLKNPNKVLQLNILLLLVLCLILVAGSALTLAMLFLRLDILHDFARKSRILRQANLNEGLH